MLGEKAEGRGKGQEGEKLLLLSPGWGLGRVWRGGELAEKPRGPSWSREHRGLMARQA